MTDRNVTRAAAWVMLGLLTATGASAATGNEASATRLAAAIESEGTDCTIAPVTASKQAALPDPFVLPDGSRITSRADWRCQRQQTLHALEQQVYGSKGPAPDSVTGKILRDRIEVTVTRGDRRETFGAALHLPAGRGPFPVMVVVGGMAGVDPALLDAEGIARIDYPNIDIGAETGTRRTREGVFFRLYGDETRSTGTLMAWAWGVSRIIDAIVAADQDLLRADAIAVTGCSRYGKGALAAGAFDQRVALTIPIESGSGGVPLWRGVAAGIGAQPPQSAFGEQPWLGDAFAAFTGDVDMLATDQHQVLGLVAPRGLLILDNPHVDWLGASAGRASALAGAEIYRALGAGGNIGYYSAVENPKHCAWRPEWNQPARDAIRRHLLGTEAEDLHFEAAEPANPPPMPERDWQAPVLR